MPAGSNGYPQVEPWECTVTEFVFSDRNTDSELTIMCHGNRVHITISAENLSGSSAVQSQYLHYLKVAESYELDGLTVDDFYDWILELCAPKLHLPRASRHRTLSLEEYLYLPNYHYALSATHDGALALVRQGTMPAEHLSSGVTIDEELCSSWTSFHPSQVQICAESPGEELSGTPRKVQTTGDQIHFFKPYRYCDTGVAKNELKKYLQISAASGLEDLLISRLSGLVRDDSGAVLGLLLSYIDSKALTLRCAIRPDTPLSSRNRWADQISNTLTSLHAAGIIWGDAKPDNVLIDSNSDAWLIDFGGSYTEGWVEPELAETVKGDLQGLSRILEYVFQ